MFSSRGWYALPDYFRILSGIVWISGGGISGRAEVRWDVFFHRYSRLSRREARALLELLAQTRSEKNIPSLDVSWCELHESWSDREKVSIPFRAGRVRTFFEWFRGRNSKKFDFLRNRIYYPWPRKRTMIYWERGLLRKIPAVTGIFHFWMMKT